MKHIERFLQQTHKAKQLPIFIEPRFDPNNVHNDSRQVTFDLLKDHDFERRDPSRLIFFRDTTLEGLYHL